MNKIEFLEKYDLIDLTNEENFIFDIKYATKDNFLGIILYK